MSNSFYSIIDEGHGLGCACYQLASWNVSSFTAGGQSTGYIVQELRRELKEGSTINIPEYKSTKYYEAWYVKNGKIVDYTKGADSNDQYSIGQPLDMWGQFLNSMDTKGCFVFSSKLYWIPYDNELFEIIDGWDRTSVVPAAGLKSTYECPALEKLCPVCIREDFVHEWDLSTEEKIYITAKEGLFQRFSEENDKERIEYFSKLWFGEKHTKLADRLKTEWSSMYLK